MANKFYGAAFGGLFLLSACGSADDSESISGQFNNSFDEGWNTEFVKGCTTEAIKAGAPAAETAKMCECIATNLGDKLDGISEKMNPPEAKINAALKACTPAG